MGNFANLTKDPSIYSFQDMDMVSYDKGVEPTQKPKDHTKGCVDPTQIFISLVKDIPEVCSIQNASVSDMRQICLIVKNTIIIIYSHNQPHIYLHILLLKLLPPIGLGQYQMRAIIK